MSVEPVMMVRSGDGLVPLQPEAKEFVDSLGWGEEVLVTCRRPRNARFHRKFFAMVNLAYSLWNPAEQSIAGHPAKKSRDTFRKELVIAAGYYDVEAGLTGPRLIPKSLAWDRMDEGTFKEVYEAVFAVLSAGILEGIGQEEAERMASELWDRGF